MQCPEFSIERIHTYGFHGNLQRQQIPGNAKEILSSCYQFCFFTEDFAGGPVIEGQHYIAKRGYFSLCKPTQHRCLKHPLQCYLLDITTKDPQLMEALNKLPSYAYHPEMDTILEMYENLKAVSARGTLDARLEIWTHSCAILRLLLQAQPEYAVAHALNGNSRRHQEALLASLKYLEDHLDEDVDLEQLAKDSHLHPTYFHKLFTAAFGKTPAKQLMHYRILAARRYLRDDNSSISEISRKCGFSSQSYFCRMFRLYSKLTPSQYRNSIRKHRKK